MKVVLIMECENIKDKPSYKNAKERIYGLTEEEVESIKRWSKTKKGKETIVIVRHMPFAPFMLVGELLFFIFRLYS